MRGYSKNAETMSTSPLSNLAKNTEINYALRSFADELQAQKEQMALEKQQNEVVDMFSLYLEYHLEDGQLDNSRNVKSHIENFMKLSKGKQLRKTLKGLLHGKNKAKAMKQIMLFVHKFEKAHNRDQLVSLYHHYKNLLPVDIMQQSVAMKKETTKVTNTVRKELLSARKEISYHGFEVITH